MLIDLQSGEGITGRQKGIQAQEGKKGAWINISLAIKFY